MEPKLLVYVATNKVNNKKYVGMTTQGLKARKTRHLFDARRGSQCHFHNAIRKYGEEAFSWEVVYLGETVEELFEKEIELIAELDTYKNGYNMTLGGEGSNGSSGAGKGEIHWNTNLTDDDALEIINLLHTTTLNYKEIAEMMGTTKSIVTNISLGIGWNHLYDEAPILNRPEGAIGGHKCNRITEEQAVMVIQLLHTTTLSFSKIAEVCETSASNVCQISQGNIWTHLYDIPPKHNRPDGTFTMTKIDEETAILAVELLLSTDKTYQEIADELGCSMCNVRNIAQGKSWTSLYLEPPVKNRPDGARGGHKCKAITESDAKEIIKLLHTTTMTYSEIADEIGVATTTVTNIANGRAWVNLYDVPPKQNRPDGAYENKTRRMSVDVAKEIVDMIIRTDLSYAEISEITKIPRTTIQSIASGRSWKHLYDIPPAKIRKLRKKWRKALTTKFKLEVDWSEVS